MNGMNGMNDERRSQETGSGTGPKHRVRLPGFITEDDVGLGDVLKRATSIAGIKPCGGCSARAARMNQWLAFSRRR